MAFNSTTRKQIILDFGKTMTEVTNLQTKLQQVGAKIEELGKKRTDIINNPSIRNSEKALKSVDKQIAHFTGTQQTLQKQMNTVQRQFRAFETALESEKNAFGKNTTAIKGLVTEFNKLSDAEQKGAKGQAIVKQMESLMNSAQKSATSIATMTSKMNNFGSSVSVLSSVSKAFDSLKTKIDSASASLSKMVSQSGAMQQMGSTIQNAWNKTVRRRKEYDMPDAYHKFVNGFMTDAQKAEIFRLNPNYASPNKTSGTRGYYVSPSMTSVPFNSFDAETREYVRSFNKRYGTTSSTSSSRSTTTTSSSRSSTSTPPPSAPPTPPVPPVPPSTTAGLSKLEKSLTRIGKSAETTQTKIAGTYNRIANIKPATGALTKLYNGFNNLRICIESIMGATVMFNFLKLLTDAGQQFADGMARVQAVTNATTQEFNNMSEIAKKMGRETKYTANEAAGALENLARNGLKPMQASQALPETLKLAQANLIDLSEAAMITTNVMNGFGMKADDLAHINDVLSSTASHSATNVSQLADALKNAAPFGHALGQPIEQVNAALGVLANIGVKGADAGTAMRMVLLGLGTTTEKQQKTFKKYGIQINEASLRSEGLAATLKKLTDSGIMESATAADDLAKIFGRRVSPAAMGLLTNVDKLNDLLLVLQHSQGENARMFEESLSPMTKTIAEIKAKWEALMISFYEANSADDAIFSILTPLKLIKSLLETLNDAPGRIFSIGAAFLVFKSLPKMIYGTQEALLGSVVETNRRIEELDRELVASKRMCVQERDYLEQLENEQRLLRAKDVTALLELEDKKLLKAQERLNTEKTELMAKLATMTAEEQAAANARILKIDEELAVKQMQLDEDVEVRKRRILADIVRLEKQSANEILNIRRKLAAETLSQEKMNHEKSKLMQRQRQQDYQLGLTNTATMTKTSLASMKNGFMSLGTTISSGITKAFSSAKIAIKGFFMSLKGFAMMSAQFALIQLAIEGVMWAFDKLHGMYQKSQEMKKWNEEWGSSVVYWNNLAKKTNKEVEEQEKENFTTEEARVKRLKVVAEGEKYTKEQRLKAIAELQKVMPSYISNLNNEAGAYVKNTQLVNDYISGLHELAKAKAQISVGEKLMEEGVQAEFDADEQKKLQANTIVNLTRFVTWNRGRTRGAEKTAIGMYYDKASRKIKDENGQVLAEFNIQDLNKNFRGGENMKERNRREERIAELVEYLNQQNKARREAEVKMNTSYKRANELIDAGTKGEDNYNKKHKQNQIKHKDINNFGKSTIVVGEDGSVANVEDGWIEDQQKRSQKYIDDAKKTAYDIVRARSVVETETDWRPVLPSGDPYDFEYQIRAKKAKSRRASEKKQEDKYEKEAIDTELAYQESMLKIYEDSIGKKEVLLKADYNKEVQHLKMLNRQRYEAILEDDKLAKKDRKLTANAREWIMLAIENRNALIIEKEKLLQKGLRELAEKWVKEEHDRLTAYNNMKLGLIAQSASDTLALQKKNQMIAEQDALESLRKQREAYLDSVKLQEGVQLTAIDESSIVRTNNDPSDSQNKAELKKRLQERIERLTKDRDRNLAPGNQTEEEIAKINDDYKVQVERFKKQYEDQVEKININIRTRTEESIKLLNSLTMEQLKVLFKNETEGVENVEEEVLKIRQHRIDNIKWIAEKEISGEQLKEDELLEIKKEAEILKKAVIVKNDSETLKAMADFEDQANMIRQQGLEQRLKMEEQYLRAIQDQQMKFMEAEIDAIRTQNKLALAERVLGKKRNRQIDEVYQSERTRREVKLVDTIVSNARYLSKEESSEYKKQADILNQTVRNKEALLAQSTQNQQDNYNAMLAAKTAYDNAVHSGDQIDIEVKKRNYETLRDNQITYQNDVIAKTNELNEAERARADLQVEITEKVQSVRSAEMQSSVQLLGSMQEMLSVYGEENKSAAKAAKMLALAQIAINLGISISEAMKGAVKAGATTGVAAPATTAATYATIVAQILSAVTAAYSTVKSANFAKGGKVTGPGTGTSDSIPANLSNGEFVMTARATRIFEPLLVAMNDIGMGVAPMSVQQSYKQTDNAKMLTDSFTEAAMNIKPVVSVVDINDGQNMVDVIQNLDTI